MPPIAALHALAGLLGIPTAPPRDALVPVSEDDAATLAGIVARRP
ncbi:hypothetical protein [Xylanimonas sp. McL0601]